MPTEFHRKVEVALFDLDFDTSFAALDSLPDGDLCWCAPVTTCEDCETVEVFARIKVGTSPTANRTIEFYIGRGDDGGTEKRTGTDDITTTDHGIEGTAADVARVLGALGGMVWSITVDATTDKIYTCRFEFKNPGADWQLFVYNNTGAALNGTSSPHSISARGWLIEGQ